MNPSTDYVIKCGLCGDKEVLPASLGMPAHAAEKRGWKFGAKTGWMCEACQRGVR